MISEEGGNDTLAGRGGTDRLDGGSGRDSASWAEARGKIRVDLSSGTACAAAAGAPTGCDYGSATLIGINAEDGMSNQLHGLGGNTSSSAGEAMTFSEELIGGRDIDFARYDDALSSMTVNLASSPGAQFPGTASGDGSDLLEEIEGVVGSQFADLLLGDGGPNDLFGQGSNDDIRGGGGNDNLHGQAKSDNTSSCRPRVSGLMRRNQPADAVSVSSAQAGGGTAKAEAGGLLRRPGSDLT